MERRAFIRDFESGEWTMSELCEHYSISRPTGYKWSRRFELAGEDGLRELSRAPRTCPHRTAVSTEAGGLTQEDARLGSAQDSQIASRKVARLGVAVPKYGLRHLEAARLGKKPSTPHTVETSGRGAPQDRSPERGVDHRLQGSVQDTRRTVLLPPHGARQLQPLPPLLPRVAECQNYWHQSHDGADFSQKWTTPCHPE